MAQQPGQISPDGLWRWDGQRWVATGAAPQPQPARSSGSMAWLWWLAGGCAVLLVIAVIAGVVGFTAFTGLVKNFQGGAYTCLPSDFPKYPGAAVVRENVTTGAHNECDMTLSSSDDVATVSDFYASRLGEGDWKDSVDEANGIITFQQVSGGRATGQVQLLAAGQHTEIRITVIT